MRNVRDFLRRAATRVLRAWARVGAALRRRLGLPATPYDRLVAAFRAMGIVGEPSGPVDRAALPPGLMLVLQTADGDEVAFDFDEAGNLVDIEVFAEFEIDEEGGLVDAEGDGVAGD